MKLLTILLLLIFPFNSPSMGNESPETDNPVQMAADEESNMESLLDIAHYDSLTVAWYEQNSYSSIDNFYNEFIDIDSTFVGVSNIPDSVYEARLRMIVSPIPMVLNDEVKRHIIVYTQTKKALMEKIMGRAKYYFPIIESELDAAGLPIELRSLAIIESALAPSVKSRAGAVGLWQFMYTTGKTYGLEITSFIDQRCDPVLSTRAACKYLKALYNMYGDWTLALAAYNCGPGNVNKAMKRAGEGVASFWDIYEYLPRETRNYVPSFIAATYAYTFYNQHNIAPEDAPVPLITDTVMVNRIMHLEQVSSTIDTPIEILRALNPQYKLDIIPATGKEYSLVLPQSEVSRFIDLQPEIMAKDTTYLAQYLKPSNIDKTKKEFSIETFTYTVKKGDTLGAIARKHGVTVSQIMKWNNIKNASKISIGKKLEIYR